MKQPLSLLNKKITVLRDCLAADSSNLKCKHSRPNVILKAYKSNDAEIRNLALECWQEFDDLKSSARILRPEDNRKFLSAICECIYVVIDQLDVDKMARRFYKSYYTPDRREQYKGYVREDIEEFKTEIDTLYDFASGEIDYILEEFNSLAIEYPSVVTYDLYDLFDFCCFNIKMEIVNRKECGKMLAYVIKQSLLALNTEDDFNKIREIFFKYYPTPDSI